MDWYAVRDNHNCGTVGGFLKETVTKNSELSFVSAYFTIYAYHQLKKNFDEIKNLRFLFGQPAFVKSLDPEKNNVREFRIEEDGLTISPEKRLEQKSAARECADWIRNKAEIRSMVKPNFLHGKLYHIRQESGIEKAIAGSSNFTVSGLGFGGNRNIELNLIADSDRDRQELKNWFDAIWNDSTGLVEDVKEEVLRYLEQIYTENDPEFVYFKTVYHVFEDCVHARKQEPAFEQKTRLYDSEIWNMLYEFQKDGVKVAISKIMKHNGCIIADSVGLGKTFEALAVIKYFENLNAKVLVLCPKKLSRNWIIYQARQNHALNPFKKDRFDYTVLYHTDMARESGKSDANGIDLENFNWSAYELVVIDESHNFRGNPMEKVKQGRSKMNRAKWLMEKIIKSGGKTKVLMLSATPVNNTLRDLRNQTAFITEGKDDALAETCHIKSIGNTLENAQKTFTRWAKEKSGSMKNLLELLDASFFRLLDELTLARSRKHIARFYNMDAIGTFPKREKPVSIFPEIDLLRRFPSYERINRQILEYRLAVFNPSAYVKAEKRRKYEQLAGDLMYFKQSDRENFLIGMMKVNYLKRLESSIASFGISLDRTLAKIENLEEKIQKFLQTKASSQEEFLDDLTPLEEELEENTDETDQWLVGKNLKFDLADLELEKWTADLRKDKDALIDLLNNAKAVDASRDAKIAELQSIIREKTEHPKNADNRKVLIFTAFADTARYLYENLKKWIRNDLQLHCAMVCGNATQTSLGKNDYDSILTNFSPISKNRAMLSSSSVTEEIDILIATDCISEGQNLQDCDFLVNYDIHWNPVRILQRFGRIDRIGSRNGSIRLVNFWPTKDLDNYINLKERVEARMALADIAGTGEDNILNAHQLEELISDDLNYRNRQLKRLQNEIPDLEDMEESISLTDFSLDDFRMELFHFMENNSRELKNAAMGMYALVPCPRGKYGHLFSEKEFSVTEKEIIKPGVIFCLAQKNPSERGDALNPLHPYFLVYLYDDGNMRYNYASARQVLEIFRLLCQGQNAPFDPLCELFNRETAQGTRMHRYSALLKKAVSEIVRVFKKKANIRLTYDRGAVLMPQSSRISELNDFELVTWLVIV